MVDKVLSVKTSDNVFIALADGGSVPARPIDPSGLFVEPASVLTPNGNVSPSVLPYSPGSTPFTSILALLDITPTRTGKLLVSATVDLNTDIVLDFCDITCVAVANLTSVTGGTSPAPGVTVTPTSFTAGGPGGPLIEASGPTGGFGEGGPQTITLTLTTPFQVAVGVRTGLVFYATSRANTPWTRVLAALSAVELA
jgi:hypothetical protein